MAAKVRITVKDRVYRGDIDGLRAIAVISVVLFHAGISTFHGGFVGVDIFFVISGYLINGLVLRGSSDDSFSFINFYSRRFRRILPALLAVVCTTILIGWCILDAEEYTELAATASTAMLGVSNFSFWHHQDYFSPDANLSPLLMTWSLGVEEQFYLIVPALTLLFSRLHPQRAIITLLGVTAASFLFSIWCTAAYPTAAFYLLPARAWELGLGGILAAAQLRRGGAPLVAAVAGRELLAGLGLFLLAASIFGLDSATPFPGATAALPVVGAAALIAAEGSWINRNVLAWAPMRWIGLVSYSWYLWHWPLMSFARIVAVGAPSEWVMELLALAALALGALTWRLIEQPFRRRRMSPVPVILCYAATVCAVVLVGLAIKADHGVPSRLPKEARAIEAVVVAGRGNCLAPWGVDRPDLSHACKATIADRPAVALLGDSHAAALGPGLRTLATRRDEGIVILTKSQCPPLLGVAEQRAAHPHLARECDAFMRRSLAELLADTSINQVLLAASWDIGGKADARYVATERGGSNGGKAQQDLFVQGLVGMVRTLQSHGKAVVIVGDVPSFPFDASRVMIARSMPMRGYLSALASRYVTFGERAPADPSQKAQLSRFEDLATRNTVHATIFGLYNRFCDGSGCQFEHEGQPLFIDDAHLSGPGSQAAFTGDIPF